MPVSEPEKKRAAASRQAIVLATPEGKIQFADATARRWLKEFFGRPTRPGLLPRKICHWLAGPQETRRGVSAVMKRQNARLFVAKQKASSVQTTLLLLELISGKGEEHSRRHRSLTPREREVLLWLTRGKSNSQIAEILAIKSATVSKHLERGVCTSQRPAWAVKGGRGEANHVVGRSVRSVLGDDLGGLHIGLQRRLRFGHPVVQTALR